jgi:hypothetical protein
MINTIIFYIINKATCSPPNALRLRLHRVCLVRDHVGHRNPYISAQMNTLYVHITSIVRITLIDHFFKNAPCVYVCTIVYYGNEYRF